jgi:hypothetical protein
MSFGAFIFQGDPPPFSVQELGALFRQDFWGTIASFFDTILYAIAAWLLVCAPLFAVIYAIGVRLLRRFGPTAKNSVSE